MAYNTYDPGRFYAEQQGQRGDWLRTMMNMFLMAKQMKQRQQQFETEQQFEQKKWETMQPYYQARTIAELTPKPIKPPEQPATVKAFRFMVDNLGWSEDKAAKGVGWTKEEKERQLTIFDKKKSYLDTKLESGEINQEQYDKALYSVEPIKTQEETEAARLSKTAPARHANETQMRQLYQELNNQKIKISKPKPDDIVMAKRYGISLDMPFVYNIARKNLTDGVGTAEDFKLVQNYYRIKQIFAKRLAAGDTWDNFKKSGLIDEPAFKPYREYIELLFSIYKKHEDIVW